METTSGIKHYKSRGDYIQKRGVESLKPSKLKSATQSIDSAHDVDISKNAKDVQSQSKSIIETVSGDVAEVGKATGHLIADAASVAKKAIPAPIPSGIPMAAAKEAIATGDLEKLSPINKPGVFFISGLHLGSISSGNDGLPQLSEAVSSGEHFSWKDEDDVFESILRRPKDKPIVLVGHSLGGDAVVNLANRLNTLEGGFRKVDLLVTLDSVGFDNDIIPKNVKKNLNYMLSDDLFYNDGPNVARDAKLTDVTNFLREEGHTDLDESNDIHFDIITNIDEVMGSYKQSKQYQRLSDMFKSFNKAEKA